VGVLLGLAAGVLAWGGRSQALGTASGSSVIVLTPVEAPVVGGLAPAFEADIVEGGRFQLGETRGRVVVLNFWATWCEPCRREMPMLQARSEADASRLLVVGINASETAAEVSDYREALGLTFPLLMDMDGEVQRLYRVRGYPTTFFVDEAGVVRQVHVGGMDDEALDNYLQAMGLN
jgi:cytochrome c biogenesis protein CcmG, thiol:disulfide interchange protein DsbE